MSEYRAKIRVRFPLNGPPFVSLGGVDITKELASNGLRITVDDTTGPYPRPVVQLTFAEPDLQLTGVVKVVDNRG